MTNNETGDEQGTERFHRNYCEEAQKACYTSKVEARKSLTGQFAHKSVRIYRCIYNKSHYHVTKDWAHKRRVAK
jgi:hypothetical protein